MALLKKLQKGGKKLEDERYFRCPYRLDELKEPCKYGESFQCEWSISSKKHFYCFFCVERKEHTLKEVSTELQIPISKVNTIFLRAIENLKNKIPKEGDLSQLLEEVESHKDRRNEVYFEDCCKLSELGIVKTVKKIKKKNIKNKIK